MKHLMICIVLTIVPALLIPVNAQQTEKHRIGLLGGEVFEIDDSHSTLKFSIKFLGLTNVEGSFDDYNAIIFYNEADMTKLSVVLRIKVNSINTGNDFRDNDLKSERFFDTEKYPEIIFRSTRVEPIGNDYMIHGILSIKDVQKEIAIPVKHTLKRTVDMAWGNIRIGFSGETELNRLDYNVTGGENWGVSMLSDEVKVHFNILGRIFDMNKIGYRNNGKKSIGQQLESLIESEGIEGAVEYYREVKQTLPDSINLSARELYVLTHRLKQNNKIDQAWAIGILYVNSYPESADAHVTMGELAAIRKDRKSALMYFKKVQELTPQDKSLSDMAEIALKRLEE